MSSIGVTPPTSTNTGTNPAQAASPGNPLANEETFLKLLVSQLQNQDPMNPTDSNQFVSQLTSYSQLEQLIGIHTDTTNVATALTGTSTTGSSGSTTNPTTNTGN